MSSKPAAETPKDPRTPEPREMPDPSGEVTPRRTPEGDYLYDGQNTRKTPLTRDD